MLSGHAYYGEYPLAFAAAFGFDEIYDFLIEHGADPNLQDSYGNTILHMLIIRDRMVGIFNVLLGFFSRQNDRFSRFLGHVQTRNATSNEKT